MPVQDQHCEKVMHIAHSRRTSALVNDQPAINDAICFSVTNISRSHFSLLATHYLECFWFRDKDCKVRDFATVDSTTALNLFFFSTHSLEQRHYDWRYTKTCFKKYRDVYTKRDSKIKCFSFLSMTQVKFTSRCLSKNVFLNLKLLTYVGGATVKGFLASLLNCYMEALILQSFTKVLVK